MSHALRLLAHLRDGKSVLRHELRRRRLLHAPAVARELRQPSSFACPGGSSVPALSTPRPPAAMGPCYRCRSLRPLLLHARAAVPSLPCRSAPVIAHPADRDEHLELSCAGGRQRCLSASSESHVPVNVLKRRELSARHRQRLAWPWRTRYGGSEEGCKGGREKRDVVNCSWWDPPYLETVLSALA